jgi:ring-1,2-phenylacetyl-CoA epoxidase subunit PaaE
VMGGVVSNHLIDQLKIDDVVEAMEPIGDFVLQEDSLDLSKHIVLWGAGSGITPLISIAKYALYKKLCGHVTLVYGNRNSESVIFKQTIQQLQNQYSNIFSSWHFYTKLVISPDNPQLLQGRIDPNKVLTVMKTDNDISNTVHYICGPQGLKVSVKSALLNLGVSAKNIFSEDFEVVRDPAEFKDITTQTVILNKSNQSFSVEVVKGKSILEAALDALIDLSYSCQTGNCLICKARLIKGNIKTVGVEQLADDLKHDERLLCCSFPLSGDVLLEVE